MRIQRVQQLGPLANKPQPAPQKAAVVTPSPKRVVPWAKCPKCGGPLAREILSKEIVERSGCKCRGNRVIVKYKYSCGSCDYNETRVS